MTSPEPEPLALRGTILATGDDVVVIATEDGLLRVPRASCAWLDPESS